MTVWPQGADKLARGSSVGSARKSATGAAIGAATAVRIAAHQELPITSARPALRRLLLASLTTLAACASLPGVHGFSASTSGREASPATATAPAATGDQSATFAGSQGSSPRTSFPRPRGEQARDHRPAATRTADCGAGAQRERLRGPGRLQRRAQPLPAREHVVRVGFDGPTAMPKLGSGPRASSTPGAAPSTSPATPATPRTRRRRRRPRTPRPARSSRSTWRSRPTRRSPAAGQARTDSAWRIGTVKSVDAAAGTFRVARGPAHGFGRARVVVASQPMP